MPDNNDISGGPQEDRNPLRADPSPLTTQALLREVGHVRIELASAIENISTRLTAMDKAVELFKQDLVRFPTDVDKQVSNLKDMIGVQIEGVKDLVFERFRTVEEKFGGVGKQFQLNEIALNAALNAAEKAVGKQTENAKVATDKAEAASAKQMDQMREIVNTSIGGLNDKIDLGGNRLTTLEGQVTGLLQTVAQLRAAPPSQRGQFASNGNGNGTSPVLPYVMGGVGFIMLVVIIIFEVLQRGAIR